MTVHVLIADDEEAARFGVRRALGRMDCRVSEAANGNEVIESVRRDRPDLIFLDLNMPEVTGAQALVALRSAGYGGDVVMVTADDGLDTAIVCMREGATDYITKPFEVERLRALVRRCSERVALEERVQRLSHRLDERTAFGALVGGSRAMEKLYALIERAAAAPLDILVRGETGTGKELIARELHRRSGRAAGPFVAVNVAAIAESLAESELFGHEKGAFTGAEGRRTGCFEQAHSGTLFLDEIGDMALPLQGKILRALQQREIQRVGAMTTIPVDIRIICATHCNLEVLMEEGGFRRDLYFRLRGLEVFVPPLRERHEDVLLLAEHFLSNTEVQTGRTAPRLSPQAGTRLLQHPWPGNVRELESVIRSAAALTANDVIHDDDLGLTPSDASWTSPDLSAFLGLPLTEGKQRLVAWFEEESIRAALEKAGGNVSRAARSLGIHRQSLQQKMGRLGIRFGDEV